MQKIEKEYLMGWNIFPVTNKENNLSVPEYIAWRGMYLFKDEKQTGDMVFSVMFLFSIKDDKITKEQEKIYNEIIESGVCHKILLLSEKNKDSVYIFESSNSKVDTTKKKKKRKV